MVMYNNGKHSVDHIEYKKWYSYAPYLLIGGLMGGGLIHTNMGAFVGALISLLFAYSAYRSENSYIKHINDTYDILNKTENGENPSWDPLNTHPE